MEGSQKDWNPFSSGIYGSREENDPKENSPLYLPNQPPPIAFYPELEEEMQPTQDNAQQQLSAQRSPYRRTGINHRYSPYPLPTAGMLVNFEA